MIRCMDEAQLIRVTYDGYDEEHDEWVDETSDRVAVESRSEPHQYRQKPIHEKCQKEFVQNGKAGYGSVSCDVCRRSKRQEFWGCRSCNSDLCDNCLQIKMAAKIDSLPALPEPVDRSSAEVIEKIREGVQQPLALRYGGFSSHFKPA